MNKTLLTAALLSSTVAVISNTVLAADVAPMVGPVKETVAEEKGCPLYIRENNLDYCAVINAPADVVQEVLKQTYDEDVISHGRWIVVSGKEVFEISKIERSTESETWSKDSAPIYQK